MIPGVAQRRRFSDLSEQEIVALAISSEEDDARIYRTYAEKLRAEFPASAAVFDGMAEEEDEHRKRLIDLHKARFGEVIPLIRREHVSGFYARRPVWLVENLGLERMRDEAENMERDAQRFYEAAAKVTTDADTRKLLGDLAAAEASHGETADALVEEHLDGEARDEEDRAAQRSGATSRNSRASAANDNPSANTPIQRTLTKPPFLRQSLCASETLFTKTNTG